MKAKTLVGKRVFGQYFFNSFFLKIQSMKYLVAY